MRFNGQRRSLIATWGGRVTAWIEFGKVSSMPFRYVRIVAEASRRSAIGFFPVFSGDAPGQIEPQLKTERSFCYQRSPQSVDAWLRRCRERAQDLHGCRFQPTSSGDTFRDRKR